MINRQNYFWVKEYLEYLLKTKKLSPDSVTRYWFYLRYLLLWAWTILLSQANTIKPVFGDYVENIQIEKKGQKVPLSKETRKKIILTARCFFEWAKAYHEEEFRALPGYWRNDLIPPRIQSSSKSHNYISIDEVLSIASLEIPEDDLVMRRIQAAVCFLYLTGQRNTAFVTTPIAAINLDELEIHQSPEEYGVQTKNQTSAVTLFLPIPPLLEKVKAWDAYMRSNVPESLWKTYPWYAHFESHWGDITLSFTDRGKNRKQALGDDIALIHRKAHVDTTKTAHDYRHGHVQYGLEHCRTVAHYHMISRNVMHASIAITDQIYATLDLKKRKKLMSELSQSNLMSENDEFYIYVRNMSKESIAEAIGRLASMMLS